MKDNSYTFNTKNNDRSESKTIDIQLNTALFYELNVELFLLSKTFKEKLVVIFANIRV
ncbi:hypothetical protein [uncultured Flavobacterium sp.]|uniref:hypothetical protein n=1 Tax=uncultured Flavobacterium sp. TaxID=165435 RepID=UPI0030C87D13